jgi:hypothetical protein
MDIVNQIGAVETDKSDKPIEPVTIDKIWEEGKEPASAETESTEEMDEN